MGGSQKKKDYLFAQSICKELQANNKEAILQLYHSFHPFFLAFTRRRLFSSDQNQIDTVLSAFWTSLLNGKAICGFKGRATLRTFLLTILNRRIIDANRKFQREIKFTDIPDEQSLEPSELPDHLGSPEDHVLREERRKIINDTLRQLSETAPRDANLIRMYLNGLSYEKMAEQELNEEQPETRQTKKKIDAIKKQFTRPQTGSLAKFKSALEKRIQQHQWDCRDLLN
jgi:RNA polymerase sigma-70 factor (ECF subfamily)